MNRFVLVSLILAGATFSMAASQEAVSKPDIQMSKEVLVEKPKVTILATGGTIAGSSKSSVDTKGYTAGSIGINALINAVPELLTIAQVEGEQIVNVDSNEIDTKTLLILSNKANELLAKDSDQAGVVITHGTDTLEESAFFLDLTVKSDKPVVLVGAMRPATAISADGPMNLLQAVSLAADKNSQKRGVLVVLNDRISSGFYVTKTNSGAVDTFKSPEQGYLGGFINDKAVFYYAPTTPSAKPYFDVSKVKTLPKVVILYGHQNLDPALLDAVVKMGVKGIVIAATGDGSLSAILEEKVKEIIGKGIPVVRSTRTGSGFVTYKDVGIASGLYNPQKSRILLSLALSQNASMKQIAQYFSGEF